MYALLTIPSATSSIALAGQDVPTWFDQISPALVLLGVPIAVVTLSVLVFTIMGGFHKLGDMFKPKN